MLWPFPHLLLTVALFRNFHMLTFRISTNGLLQRRFSAEVWWSIPSHPFPCTGYLEDRCTSVHHPCSIIYITLMSYFPLSAHLKSRLSFLKMPPSLSVLSAVYPCHHSPSTSTQLTFIRSQFCRSEVQTDC